MIRLKETDLFQCCGSKTWAKEMAAHAFPNFKEVFATGDSIWWSLNATDWKEAFQSHPRLGDRNWFREENATPRHTSDATLTELKDLSRTYEEKFGYNFIISANGKTAHGVLEALRNRLTHPPAEELRVAAEQQLEIMHHRLRRILSTT